MHEQTISSIFRFITLVISLLLLTGSVSAQCPDPPTDTFATNLRAPLSSALTNQGNILISETGNTTLRSGRISILDQLGNRRTLLDGIPSAINDVNEPAGPAGIFMRGRTLYVAIGTGDVGRPGPAPGSTMVNPNPISSPIFSSVLGLQFSANTEDTTSGF